jgi:dihydropteroate synthase
MSAYCTSKAAVADVALRCGATIVNDVTALCDPAMAPLVAEHGAAIVLMHMRGEPRTMQVGEITYDDVVADIAAALEAAIGRAVDAGIARSRVLVDPGIGFGKTVDHNLTLTRRLGELAALGRPIVYGPSRKRFLGDVTGRGVDDRDRATAAACAIAVAHGAHVLRVHDVGAVRDAIAVAAAVRDAP